MVPKTRVLLVELKGRKSQSFAHELTAKGYEVALARTGRKAAETLASFEPNVLVVDTTFSPWAGEFVCHTVRSLVPGVPMIYIGAAGRPQPPWLRADVFLRQPFTIRKLINRIQRLLPSADGPTLQVGQLTLHVEKRSLHRNKREHRLTPKQAHLLEVLMRHPGELITRRELMKRVWDTDYMDDTRTLDVHIRWVREAAEADPSKPRYIKTVRGKGYQFAIPPTETA